MLLRPSLFFFNDTATTEIYTLSLHDALPISRGARRRDAAVPHRRPRPARDPGHGRPGDRGRNRATRPGAAIPLDRLGRLDRKSTRLNSSHANISYAVFCLKKKKHIFTYLRLK